MPTPTCVSNVHRLTGRIMVLNRFVSKFVERSLLFFKKLRKVPNFLLTEDCQHTFNELKRYLSSIHILRSLKPREELYIYLAASEQEISVLLLRVEEGIQKPVYYVSKVLKGPKLKYLGIEKLALALVIAVRKFKVYLNNQQGIVMIDQPLRKMLHLPETYGCMLAQSIEIGSYYLQYRPCTKIKAHVLADFIAECSFNESQELADEKGFAHPKDQKEEAKQEQLDKDPEWKLFVDGSSNSIGSRVGIVLKGPYSFAASQCIKIEFSSF